MSPRARAFIGIITTVFFVGTGISLMVEGQTALGGVLLGLGLLRGFYALRQLGDARGDPDEA